MRLPTHLLIRPLLSWAAALAVLALVFALYTRPEFLVTVADLISACF